MDVVEHLTLCENILNESLNDDKKHSVKSFEDKGGTLVLQVTKEYEDYTFCFKLIPDEEKSTNVNITDYNNYFYYKDKHTVVEIKDIAVKGYVSVNFQEIDTSHLKNILNSLAWRYAKEIKRDHFETISHRSYFLSQNYDKFLNDLFNLVDEIDTEDIDKQLLKEGIKTIIHTGEKALALNENILFITGNVFQKKIFFKETDDGSLECKILNTGPGTPLPLVYDILLVVFYFTDQKGRQEEFHELVEYFYIVLAENFNNLNFDITTILPLQKYEMHIRTFIPYVKLEIAHYYYQQLQKNPAKYKKMLLSAILELNECVLYPNITREDCNRIIRNKIGSSHYDFLGFKLIPLEERAGLMGDYFKLKIRIRHENKEEIIHLFAKYVPTAKETMRETSLSIFKKEEFIYSILIPEFVKVGLEDITDFSPRCYFLRTDDVIILEDMSEMNYLPVGSKEPLSYEMMHVVIKKLAHLHASSLLYEEILSKESEKNIRIGDKYKEYIEEKFFQKNEEKLVRLHNVGIATVLNNIIDEFPDVVKDLTMEEFKEKARLRFNTMFEKVNKSENFRNVLCHGDIWTANILFKLDCEPADCCIIDYQLTRYCPPAHDLLCLFYVNSNQATRKKYMSKLIHDYYEELAKIFKKHDCDLKEIYSYELFVDSCHYMRSQSICQAALYYQTSLCPDIIASLLNDREKFDHYCLVDRTEVMKEMMKRTSFRQRFKEIVEELYYVCVNTNR